MSNIRKSVHLALRIKRPECVELSESLPDYIQRIAKESVDKFKKKEGTTSKRYLQQQVIRQIMVELSGNLKTMAMTQMKNLLIKYVRSLIESSLQPNNCIPRGIRYRRESAEIYVFWSL